MKTVENTCRICLKTSKRLLSFQDSVSKGKTVFECFEDLKFGIQENQNESKICKHCIDDLKIAHNFKQQCIKNDKKYQEMFCSKSQVQVPDFQEIFIKEEATCEASEFEQDKTLKFEIKEELAVKEKKMKTNLESVS